VYGPPPDPRQLAYLAETADYLGCLGVGVLLCVAAWRVRRFELKGILVLLAVVVVFTMPWLPNLDSAWFGDFPTIDKEGSLLFFEQGVHQRLYGDPLSAPDDAAVRLIGVHAGHLWLTALLHGMGLSAMGAFNAQWLLQMALGWASAWWLVAEVVDPDGLDRRAGALAAWVPWAVAFPFGMGLHMFRDLNWTTVEKGGVFWLALFGVAMVRAARRGGRWTLAPALVYALMALYNLYFAIVGATVGMLGAGVLTVGTLVDRGWRQAATRWWLACLGCAALGLPIAGAQLAIQAGGPALASPERFLWERAGLDGFSLVPFRWNRLEVWRACNPAVMGLAAWSVWRWRRDRRLWAVLAASSALFIVSLGPVLIPGDLPDQPVLTNPVYLAIHAVVPGFWRMAKPEVFFEAVWLTTTIGAGLGLRALRSPTRVIGLMVAILVAWWPLVRLHAAYPGLSAAQDSALDPRWQQRVFESSTTPRP